MKNEFTPEQIAILEQNRYTKLVSPSMIKFTEDFLMKNHLPFNLNTWYNAFK